MSISRYQGDDTNTVTGLIAWLNANKAGTFLEDATIEADSAWSGIYGSVLKITLEDVAFSLGYFQGAVTNTPLCKYNVTGGIDYTQNLAITSGTWAYKQGDAILCKNGVIFSGKWTLGSTEYQNARVYYGIFKGNDGELCLIKGDQNAVLESTTNEPEISNNVNIISPAATISGQAIFLKPARSTLSTQIAQAQVVESETPVLLENAFLALKTQYVADNDAPGACILDGKTYITNGRWYILDE